jgi:hypothetical protein
MREIGTLVWVVLLVIGVIGSMVSSARRQGAAGTQVARRQVSPAPAASAQQRLAQALQARVQAAPASPSRAPQPRPAPPRPQSLPRREAPAAPTARRAKQRSFFGSRPELVRAVIAAEVLGKPRGLHDEYR